MKREREREWKRMVLLLLLHRMMKLQIKWKKGVRADSHAYIIHSVRLSNCFEEEEEEEQKKHYII